MKFAFIIMGEGFSSEKDKAVIHSGDAEIIGVSSLEEAVKVAKELKEEKISCIELCGAFGKKGAEAITAATENKIPVGYVTHLEKQNALYKEVFGE